jgi:hypothetical protein
MTVLDVADLAAVVREQPLGLTADRRWPAADSALHCG